MIQEAPPSIPVSTPPADAIMMQLLLSPLLQQCIYVAAELKIADLVAARPRTVAELAETTGTHESSLYRMLRALAGVGIFAQNHTQQFELTPMAAFLRSDVPHSLRDWALVLGNQWHWRMAGELMHTIKTGETAQEKVFGMNAWDFMAHNPEIGNVFNRAMTNLSLLVIPQIVKSYDFSGVKTLVDIAGGYGSLLAGVLQANPTVQGVLFEMPSVMEGASQLLEKEGLSGRVQLVAGDYFESVPQGADLYLMKHIIHDWDDAPNIRILKNIKAAMGENARLLIMEMVVPEGNEPSPSKLTDVQMLIGPGGRERTASEFSALLEAAGLKLTRILPTRSPVSILEAQSL